MRVSVIMLAAALAFAGTVVADEPAGRVAASAAWSDAEHARLDLEVVALVDLAGLDVTFEPPAGWLVTGRGADGPSIAVGPLPARAAVSLDGVAEVRRDDRGGPAGGVLDVVLSGVTAAGTPFVERVGVAVGSVAPTRVRAGAREVRASGPAPASVPGRLDAWTASGIALYRDRAFGPTGFTGEEPLLPIREADVEVIDAASGEVLATGVTAQDGSFAVQVADSLPRDVAVRVLTRADGTPDLHLSVTDVAGLPHALASAVAPAHPPTDDLDVGTLLAEVGLGGEPFNTYDAALDGVTFLGALLGARPDDSDALHLIWEADRGQTVSSASFLLIQVRDTGAYDDTVVLHELGHWAVFRWSDSDNPGGSHGFAECDQVPELAWDEGHATFFAAAVRRFAGRPLPHVYVSTTGGAGPGHLRLYADLETETEYSCLGSTGEVAIFTALWDVHDDAAVADFTPGVDDDPLGLDDDAYWRTMVDGLPSHRDITAEDYWDAWFEPPVSNGNVDAMRTVFGAVGIEYFPDDFEPNDAEDAAIPVVAGPEAYRATFFSDPEDDGSGDEIREVDWYVFNLSAGGHYVIETRNLLSAADTSLRLRDPGGGNVASNDDRAPGDPSSLIEWVALEAGPHTLEVKQPRDWTWYGSYDLSIDLDPAVDSDSDGIPDPQDEDRDGDGVLNDADCAPDRPATSAPPGAVPALGWEGGDLVWQGALEAHVYDVYRSRFTVPATVAQTIACDAAGVTGLTRPIGATPPSGTVDAYLVTGRNGCGDGPIGAGTGTPRDPASPCAPDLAADGDGDGLPDVDDACPTVPDPAQTDGDGDRIGDACDPCPDLWDPSQTLPCEGA